MQTIYIYIYVYIQYVHISTLNRVYVIFGFIWADLFSCLQVTELLGPHENRA